MADSEPANGKRKRNPPPSPPLNWDLPPSETSKWVSAILWIIIFKLVPGLTQADGTYKRVPNPKSATAPILANLVLIKKHLEAVIEFLTMSYAGAQEGKRDGWGHMRSANFFTFGSKASSANDQGGEPSSESEEGHKDDVTKQARTDAELAEVKKMQGELVELAKEGMIGARVQNAKDYDLTNESGRITFAGAIKAGNEEIKGDLLPALAALIEKATTSSVWPRSLRSAWL